MATQQIGQIVQQVHQMSQTSLCRPSTNLVRRYGEKTEFLTKFNPEGQQKIVHDISKCVNGNYPTLAELNRDYGNGMSKAWLIPQLYDLCQYCGVRDKLNTTQYAELAFVISTEHYYLKVTELMLFFHKFKAGHYGKFYGNVDPLVITTSLNEFVRFRNTEIARFEQEQEEKRRAEHDAKFPPMTYEEYLKQKNQRAN